MTTLIEGTHPGGFLVWEAFRDYTRETVTVAAGTLEPGTVLGRITASGKYAAHDPAAVDGTETAVAVLWGKADASGRGRARRRAGSRPRHRQPPRPRLRGHADRGRDRGRPCGAPRRGHPRPLIPRHPAIPEPEAFQNTRSADPAADRMLNALRSHLAEFGIVAAKGPRHVMDLIRDLRAGGYEDLPEVARTALLGLASQLEALAGEVRVLERQLMAWHRADAASRRLATIPGVGFITATAMVASIPDPGAFASGRQFAAFLGLVPRQNSSGGKDRFGG